MKRRDLIRHLEGHGCEFLREGRDHTVYVNRAAQKTSTFLDTPGSTISLPERSVETYKYLGPEMPRDKGLAE